MEEPAEILELRTHYRNIFQSPSGSLVFNDMVIRSGFFDELSSANPEAMGARNFMLEIIKILGAWSVDPLTVSNAVSDALLRQPIQTVKKDEEDL
jgi:hypothetical protein